MRTSVGPRTDTALPDRYSSRMRFVTADGRAPCRGAVNRTSPPQDGVSRLGGGPPDQPADSAACGLSAPVVTSAMMTMPSAIRYQTNGMKLLWEMNFMNQAMTA